MTVTRQDLLKNVISVVWLGLIALTLAAWWLGVDGALSSVKLASVLILLIAFTKARFVGLYFMELRHSPLSLRIVFETWCGVVCTTLIVMYLINT